MATRRQKRTVASSPICVVNHDGSLTFRGKRITVPEVFLEEVIGAGANGFVVKGRHRILSVPLAVKFWVSLRTSDARDKMAQGIAEVKKLINAERYRSVVLWRTAGVASGLFYAVMDLFHGQTLESWLKDSHPLGLRRQMAFRLVDDVCGMAHSGLYHGDLHTRNVLIDTRASPLLDRTEPKFGIIDFGTSMFTSRGASKTRHWRVFTETLDQLVWPFRLHLLARISLPTHATASAIRTWYRTSLASIRHVCIRLGAQWLIEGEELHEFYKSEFYKSESESNDMWLAEFFAVPEATLDLAKKLIRDGSLELSEQRLGDGYWWSPFERRLDSATLDGFGPPWNTSITD